MKNQINTHVPQAKREITINKIRKVIHRIIKMNIWLIFDGKNQKEAKILYEEDIERLKTIERMKEKDMRLIEQTLKMKKQKDLKKEELKKAAEEKGQKVK